MADTSSFTAETARVALNDILENLGNEENAPKLNDAKTNAGNDMVKMMHYVFPTVVQIEMDVIKKYGFTDNREGVIQFTQLIVQLEKEDDVIADLHGQIKAHYLPPVTASNDASI